MTSSEVHEAIRNAMAEVSRRLASGELDGSGRFYSKEEWEEKLSSLRRADAPRPLAARRKKGTAAGVNSA
ncbi:MAG TPA: hypothetical protein VE291_08900 [Terracidiphilus sp.]|jgi:hypothetical protein|nr:hypothetical protein [Terracidiphilus sp.]